MAKQPIPTNPVSEDELSNFPRAGFLRRFGVIIYDALIIVAVAFLGIIVALITAQITVSTGLVPMPESGEIADLLSGNLVYQIYMLLVIGSFYVWFWTHGGQTVGMKAWRLRIQNTDGTGISNKQAIIRMVSALFGLGNILVIFDRTSKLALQDRLAGCEVVVLSKEANQHKNWQRLY